VTVVEPPPGMWQRRREFVADEIERVAIELFAQRGFADVTVDEIAEAAGISPRTVFRYFPTKSDLVRAHQRRLFDRLVRALASRPTHEGPVTALREALLATSRMRPEDRERIVLVGRLLRSTGPLVAQGVGRDVGFEGDRDGELVALLAERVGPDASAPVWPAVVVAAMTAAAQTAFRAWLAHDGEGELTAMIADALDVLEAGIGRLDRPPSGRR
jgi:AcrR family transcriptional regulator